MNAQQAHRHPDFPGHCTICDPPRQWSVMLLTAAEVVILAAVFAAVLLAVAAGIH